MLIDEIKKLPFEEIEKIKKKIVLKPLHSAEELQAWMYLFMDISFPLGTVYPTSTHGPADAMYRIYELMYTRESQNTPQIAMLASRDSYKTLGAAAIEVLCMIHFRISIAHGAAIKPQSEKAVQYVNAFFRKLRPYLEHHGWKKTSDSKIKIEWLTEKEEAIYLRVVVATVAGMNSEHVPMLFLDEIDVVQDPRALKEAKMIPSVFGSYFPLTVYLSTRKFAGGLMEKTLKETPDAGGEILRWNILDVCERITHEEARIEEPKVVRYVSRELPMENIAPEDWRELKEENQIKYERIEAYAGIANHPMLPIMRNFLVDRPQSDVGNLYKPLIAVHNNFRQTPPDMGEAQLLCNKPSSSGLVYPRFENQSNVLTVSEAIQRIAGESCDIDSFEYLRDYLKNLGIPIIGGADWGFSDMTCLVIIAILPTGEAWLLDSIAIGKLELDDIVKYCSGLQREWDVDKWYVDQAYPAYIKTLKRHGIKCPKFKKVVEDGITALQAKIVDSNNIRKFFVVDTPNNKIVIDAFGEYRWALDGKGDIIEGKPFHGTDGTSDIMDAIRYPAQNVFIKGAAMIMTSSGVNANKPIISKAPTREENKDLVKKVNNNIMSSKISELATIDKNRGKIKKKGRIFWG